MKKKLPSLREVRNKTIWKTLERLGYSYKARRRKAAVAEKRTRERLQRAMASRHALLHVHASLDPNVAIRFVFGWVKL